MGKNGNKGFQGTIGSKVHDTIAPPNSSESVNSVQIISLIHFLAHFCDWLCCLDGGGVMERGDGLFLLVSPVMLGSVTQAPVALQPEGGPGDPFGSGKCPPDP